MTRTLLTSIVICLALLAPAAQSHATTVIDPELGFKLHLPPEFIERPDLGGVMPGIVYAFQYGESPEGELLVLLMVQKLGSELPRRHPTKRDLPPDFEGELFITTWQGLDVNGFEVPEQVEGTDAVNFNVQIPLRGEGIQIMVFGPADRKESLRLLLSQVLDGLEGESNWRASLIPYQIAESPYYDLGLICLGIGIFVGTLIFLWVVSSRAPKGTVLVIAAVIVLLSWVIGHVSVPEVQLLAGTLRFTGIAGGLLGLVDLSRKRNPVPAVVPTDLQEFSPSPPAMPESSAQDP